MSRQRDAYQKERSVIFDEDDVSRNRKQKMSIKVQDTKCTIITADARAFARNPLTLINFH